MIVLDSIPNSKVSTTTSMVNSYCNFEGYSDLEIHYENVETFVKKVAEGNIGSLIVNGPPGLGKTYSVETYLSQYCNSDYKIVTGHISLLSLYGELYFHKEKGQVLVLDDIDSIFSKVEGLNLLKAAMDTKSTREIHWATSSNLLTSLNLPSSFQFNGSVILISNVGFGNAKKTSKLNEHLLALKDRSYLLTTKDVTREGLFKQVCFMVLHKKLLSNFSLTEEQECDILNYIGKNLDSIGNVSLRVAVKLAMLVVAEPEDWKSMASTGLLFEAN